MANEKRLIDKNPLIYAICDYIVANAGMNDVVRDVFETTARWLDECPTVDAVEVVRCADCKHLRMAGKPPFSYLCCMGHNVVFRVKADDFCSRGERRCE